MIKIPGELNWVQSNTSDRKGTLRETFNVDLESNRDYVRTTRAKLMASGDGTASQIGAVGGIGFSRAEVLVFAGYNNDNMWVGGNSPFDTLTLDATSVQLGEVGGDVASFQDKFYVTTATDVEFTTNNTTFTAKSASLTATEPHLMTVKGDRLYIMKQRDQIISIDSSNNLDTSGDYTLDLDLGDLYFITVFMSGTDRVWIGVTSLGISSLGGDYDCWMYTWDGVTANTISKRYKIDAPGIMCGTIKDDVPYILTADGRLMVYNGGNFQEIDRLPNMEGKTFKNFNALSQASRAIHPRAMTVDGDEILINVSNLIDNDDESTFADFPAGVWAWNKRNGLYHKHSSSYQAVADTGTTNLTDYGQMRIQNAGPIKVIPYLNRTSSDGGHLVWGASYFADADDTSSDVTYGVFTDDTADNTEKAGYIVTPKLHASKFRDRWQKVYAMLDSLSSGEKCSVKFRTDDTETISNFTWNDTDRLTPISDVTAHTEGDEVQILQGTGAGASVQVKDPIDNAGDPVRLDNSITGVSGTGVAKFSKFKEVGQITDEEEGYTIGETSKWIQFKIYMQWTGAKELYDLLVENEPDRA